MARLSMSGKARDLRNRLELRELARQYGAATEAEDQPRREQISRLMEMHEPGATQKVLEKINSGADPDSAWSAN